MYIKVYVMKVLFVLLMLGMTFVLNSQKRHHFDEVAYADFDDLSNTYIEDKTPDSSSIVILRSTKLPLTGMVYTKWENNQLNFEYNYKEGLADGLCRQWYVNGQLSIELNYKAGEILSQKCWDKDGNDIECPEIP